jgi:hypothetical protein
LNQYNAAVIKRIQNNYQVTVTNNNSFPPNSSHTITGISSVHHSFDTALVDKLQNEKDQFVVLKELASLPSLPPNLCKLLNKVQANLKKKIDKNNQ